VRRIELTAPLPASAADAWRALLDTEGWGRWGRFAPSARGALTPGSVWEVQLAGNGPSRTMRPRLLSVDPGRELRFETRILGGLAARLTHAFVVEAAGEHASLLRQRFEISGPLVLPLWPILRDGAEQFAALGEDLARGLAADGAGLERGGGDGLGAGANYR
jgi:hypothetical protein